MNRSVRDTTFHRLRDEAGQSRDDRGIAAQVLHHEVRGTLFQAIEWGLPYHLLWSKRALRTIFCRTSTSNVSLNCKLDLRLAFSRATDRLHRSYALATFELQNGYIQATGGLQIAFGLLSRSRPILRLGRAVFLIESPVLAGGNGFADSPRGDTPYAPTRCRQTRADAGFRCVTRGPVGVTPQAALPMTTSP